MSQWPVLRNWPVGLILCRRFVRTVPGSSPGARPVPGVCPRPAQTARSPQRPDGARWVYSDIWSFRRINLTSAHQRKRGKKDMADICVAQVWPGKTTSPRRSSAESWVASPRLAPNLMRSRQNSKKTDSISPAHNTNQQEGKWWEICDEVQHENTEQSKKNCFWDLETSFPQVVQTVGPQSAEGSGAQGSSWPRDDAAVRGLHDPGPVPVLRPHADAPAGPLHLQPGGKLLPEYLSVIMHHSTRCFISNYTHPYCNCIQKFRHHFYLNASNSDY